MHKIFCRWKNAFATCDDVLKSAVEGISDLITTPGIINIDFADIKAIMEGAGPALMGIGIAEGDDRAKEAAKRAVNSPLLDISITGAKGILFVIAGSDDLGIMEVQEAAKVMAIPETVITPDAALTKPYDEKYRLFIQALKTKNILQ